MSNRLKAFMTWVALGYLLWLIISLIININIFYSSTIPTGQILTPCPTP